MTDEPNHAPSEIVETTTVLTVSEVCESCRVEAQWIEELVAHGVVAPTGGEPLGWTFTQTSVLRIAKARRLESDFALNVPGLALVLDLLDEIDTLRRRVRASEGTPPPRGETGDG